MRLTARVALGTVLTYVVLIPSAAWAGLDPSFSKDGKLVIDHLGRITDLMESGGKIIAVGTGWTVMRFTGTGAPDPSFSGDGIGIFGEVGSAVGVAARVGGGYWVGGSANGDFAILAVTSEGEVDTTFGGGDGIETVDLGAAETALAMRVDPSGRMLVAGFSLKGGDTQDMAVARFTSDGAPDASFGAAGGVLVDAGTLSETATDVATTQSGRPVLVGELSQAPNRIVVAKLEMDGDPDPAFGGGDGLVLTGVGNNSAGGAVDVLANGSILVGATTWKGAGPADGPTFDFVVMRLTAAGEVDTAFGTGGRSITDFGGRDGLADIVVMGDGSILAVGSADVVGADDFGLVRYTKNGVYDPVFGKQRTHFFTDQFGNRSDDEADTVELLSDGRLLLGGMSTANLFPSTGERMALARYTKPLPACTIIGTPGPDAITGKAGPDVICGLDGNDVLKGLGGDDILLGGTGDDTLRPGPGADQNLGGSGVDSVVFDVSGNGVTANLSAGSATGQGADTLAEVERMSGTGHADALTGSGGANQLKGLGGYDVVRGLAGNDALYGGLGNDVLDGGPGSDACVAGGGSDTEVSCER